MSMKEEEMFNKVVFAITLGLCLLLWKKMQRNVSFFFYIQPTTYPHKGEGDNILHNFTLNSVNMTHTPVRNANQ